MEIFPGLLTTWKIKRGDTVSVFIAFAAITSLLCYFMVILPSLTFILAIAWGSTLIISAFYLTNWQLISIFTANVLIWLGLAGPTNLLFYLGIFGVSAFVMSCLARHKPDYYYLQKKGFIAAIVGVSLFLIFLYLGSGQIGIGELETQLHTYIEESLQTYDEAGIFDFYQERGISRDELENTLSKVVNALAWHLPAFYYLQAILAVFFMLFFAAYASQKRHNDRLKKRPYDQEIMPWQMVWVIILGLGLWLWGRDEFSYIYYAGSNLLVVLTPIAVYFGLAIAIFKLKQYPARSRRNLTIVLIILTLVFPVSAIIFFAVIGMFDSLLDFRKKRTPKEE